MSCAHSAGRAERGCALRSPQRVLPSWPVQRSWVAEGNLSDALSDIGRPGSGPPAAGPRAGRQGLERRGAVRRRHSECCRAGRQERRPPAPQRELAGRARAGNSESRTVLQCAAGDSLATAAVIVGCSNLI